MADGDDLISSTMYSLLNYLTSTPAKESNPGYAASTRSAGDHRDHRDKLETMTMNTTAHTFYGTRTDDQKKRINASTIAVVTRLAIEFNQPEVRRKSELKM